LWVAFHSIVFSYLILVFINYSKGFVDPFVTELYVDVMGGRPFPMCIYILTE